MPLVALSQVEALFRPERKAKTQGKIYHQKEHFKKSDTEDGSNYSNISDESKDKYMNVQGASENVISHSLQMYTLRHLPYFLLQQFHILIHNPTSWLLEQTFYIRMVSWRAITWMASWPFWFGGLMTGLMAAITFYTAALILTALSWTKPNLSNHFIKIAPTLGTATFLRQWREQDDEKLLNDPTGLVHPNESRAAAAHNFASKYARGGEKAGKIWR